MRLLTPGLVLTFLLSACSSTYVTSSWKAAHVPPAAFKKLVVIALVGDHEKNARELIEKHAVEDLKSFGQHAVCSCEEYSPEAFKGLNEKEAVAKLKEKGVDGILTIVLLDKKKEQHYVQPRAVNVPVFWDYYHTIYDRIYTKGYYTENTKYYWESNLYDIPGNQLLYSVTSQSFDPESTEKLAHEYGKLIVKKLVKKDVLVKDPGEQPKPF